MLLGAEQQARYMFKELERLYEYYPDIVSKKTMNFWSDAVGRTA